MKSFTILEHPSDVGIEARGTTLGEAFESAVDGAVSLMIDASVLKTEIKISATFNADDVDGLLFQLIGEVIYLRDSKFFLPASTIIKNFSETHVDVDFSGERIDHTRHKLLADVKAMTYHQMKIERFEKDWRIRFFVDV